MATNREPKIHTAEELSVRSLARANTSIDHKHWIALEQIADALIAILHQLEKTQAERKA